MAQIAPKPVQSTSSSSGIEEIIHQIPKGDGAMLYDKTNYILMALGVILIAVGFMLMSGGGSADPNVFNPDEVYSDRRITYAPIVIILGFVVEIIAVLKKPSERV